LDNAKKSIEEGIFDGMRSDAHEATATGCIVGKSHRYTAGSAINPLNKILTNFAQLLAPRCL
jgi:Na+/H+-translocating membrane pyrophosphatase